jgi:hypothetical protein
MPGQAPRRVLTSVDDAARVYDSSHYSYAPITALNPSSVRFSQASVNNVDEIATSMRA